MTAAASSRKRSGIPIARSIELKHRLMERIDGFTASIVKGRGTFDEFGNRFRFEVLETTEFRTLPEWAQHEVRGYYWGKSDMIARYLVVFAYRAVDDGKLYQTSLSYPHCDMPTWDELRDRLGHFNDSCYTERGTYWPCGKPYYVAYSPVSQPTTTSIH